MEYAGAVYYLSSAGNRGEKVFRDSEDGEAWTEILGRVCERFGWKCLCYCLVSDRYHLVVETPRPNLSKAMRQLNGVFTQHSNRRQGTAGHVFGGRYRSVVVQREKYLLPLIGHVFAVPLRAGFVRHPKQFKWSSCRYVYGKETAPGYMDLGWFEDGFSSDITRFDGFLRENYPRDVLGETQKQIYLGDERFIESVQEKAEARGAGAEIPRTQLARPVKSVLDSFRKKGAETEEAVARTYLTGNYTLREISEAVSVHYSGVSKMVSDYEKTRRGDDA